MTTALLLRRAAALGGTSQDLTAYVGRKGTPFFDQQQSLIELGMRCYNGEASQGSFIVEDPDHDMSGDIFPSAHWLVTWTEDGPGFAAWLFRGRVATDEGARGVTIIDDEVEWTVEVEDCNVELRYQAFTEPWVRPEETDVQRLVALQLYTLNGSSSTATYHRDTCNVTVNTGHLTPNLNTVTMPAKKYLAGTQPEDVIRDCADTAGKQYGVVIHHSGGSHLCLLYIVNNDHTTYLSPVKISDTLADWDPLDPSAPILEPHWEQGSAIIIGMQTLLSGLVGVWGNGETGTFVEYPGVEDQTDYWVEAYHDGDSTTQAQVADRTAGILEGRRNSHVTNRVSIILQPEQVDLVTAGMSIEIKSATNFEDADAYFTKRIAECRFEPRHDGTYWAHLDLERPPLRVAPGRGKVGPIPPVQSDPPVSATVDAFWSFAADNLDDGSSTYPWGTIPTNWHAGFVHSHVLSPGIGMDTPYVPVTAGNTYHVRAMIARTAGSPYNTGGIVLEVTTHPSGLVLDTYGPVDIGSSGGGVPIEVGGDVVIPVGETSMSMGVPHNNSIVFEAEISHGGTTGSFTGTPAPPASGTTPGGSIGTSPIWSPSDHEHLVQTAESTPIGDAGGFYAGANVEEALQELGAASGATAHVYDPRTYGAVADGVTDDTTAVQDAIDDASNVGGTVNGGGKIYFISGSPALLVDQNSRVVITNLTLKFGANTVALKWDATAGGGAHGGLIDSVYFWSTSTTGTTAVYLEDQDRVTLRNVRIDACAVGIDFHPDAEWVEGTSLQDVWINGCTTGIRFFGAGGTSSFHETSLQSVGINNCATGINIMADSQMYRGDWVGVTIWPAASGTGIIIDGEMEGFRGYIGFDGAAGGGGSSQTGFSVGANATGLDRCEIWTQYEAAMGGVTFTPKTGVLAGSFNYKVGQRTYSTGASQTGRFVGVTTSGSPATGTYLAGDFVSSQDGNVYVCTAGGTPGTWNTVGSGSGSSVPPSILLESGHATPFTFDEILQESDGSDFLWASE